MIPIDQFVEDSINEGAFVTAFVSSNNIYAKKMKMYISNLELSSTFKPIKFIDVDLYQDSQDLKQHLIERTGVKMIPWIFINKQYIGGYNAWAELRDNGEFEKLCNI